MFYLFEFFRKVMAIVILFLYFYYIIYISNNQLLNPFRENNNTFIPNVLKLPIFLLLGIVVIWLAIYLLIYE